MSTPGAHESLDQQTLLLAALMARFEQRETRMREVADRTAADLRGELGQLRLQVERLVDDAAERIANDAGLALAAVATRHDRDAAMVSARLAAAARAARAACIALAGLLALCLLLGWTGLSHYRGELARVRGDIQHYERAESVLRAYAASDAMVCGERLCANIDPGAERHGDTGQYRPLRQRPTE